MTESEYKAGFNSVDNKEWIWGHAQTNDQSNASYQFHYLDTTTKGSYYYSFNVDPYFRDLFEDGDYVKKCCSGPQIRELTSHQQPMYGCVTLNSDSAISKTNLVISY